MKIAKEATKRDNRKRFVFAKQKKVGENRSWGGGGRNGYKSLFSSQFSTQLAK
jgi:hypothetical protein